MPIELTCELRSDTRFAGYANSFDAADIARHLAVLESAGFQRVVLAEASSNFPDFSLFTPALRDSTGLELALTHRAGDVEPAVFAEKLSSLDRESGARLSLRFGGEASAASSEGHVAHWQRTDEFLVLLKRLWLNERPFDHEGAFYRLQNASIADKGVRGDNIPIRIAGAFSGTALKIAGRHADVFELPAGSPSEIRVLIGRLRAAASDWGRAERIRFALPVRVGSAAHSTPVQAAIQLLSYAEMGIEEFIVSGAGQLDEIEHFGRETAKLLRNSVGHREQPRLSAISRKVSLFGRRA